MRYKESAIAVMVAVMLVAASLLGGFAVLPAFATHDRDAVQVTTKQFSKEDDEITDIGAIEFSAKKSVLRASGTITIEILQDGDVLDSATFSASELTTTYTTHEVRVDAEAEGSFEILMEYLGSGSVQGSIVSILGGTETAETPPQDDPGRTGDEDESDQPEEIELENVVARKKIALEDDETLDVQTVEFIAKKSVLRASGTITVAIVQDDEALATDSLSASDISTVYSDIEARFDIEVTGEFEVVIMYEGSGSVQAGAIEVPGQTIPAEEPANDDEAGDEHEDGTGDQDGLVHLTINSVNQNNEPITGLWFTVTNGMTTQGDWTEKTLELEAGQYTVTMDNFYDSQTDTLYTFVEWTDSTQGKSRTATLNTDETFTAKYNVVSNAPPPEDDPQDNPPSSLPTGSAPGTITAYAYRIPSSFWGSTFVSANAQMYYVLYNSTGYMIYGGFYDENGDTVPDLNEGETYWIMPTDCHHCHGGTHDVAFNHWEDGSIERTRAVTTGMSVGAYYEYVPDTP